MDPLLMVLSQLALGLATNGIYDLMKGLAKAPLSQADLLKRTQAVLDQHNVPQRAEAVIETLVQNKLLKLHEPAVVAIRGPGLVAGNTFRIGTVTGTTRVFDVDSGGTVIDNTFEVGEVDSKGKSQGN